MGPKSSDEGPCERWAEGCLGQTDRRHREGAWVAVESQPGGRRPLAEDSESCQSRAEVADSLSWSLCGELNFRPPEMWQEFISVVLNASVLICYATP